MSHQFESGFSVREHPWHGLGRVIDEAPEDQAEILRLAGQDYEVIPTPLHSPAVWDGDVRTMESCEVKTHKALRHSLTGEVLGVVSNRYETVQNDELLKTFGFLMRDRAVSIETAGVLASGKRVWWLFRVNIDPIEAVKGDEIKPYLLCGAGHDGRTGIRVAFTGVRVVCANTERLAIGEAEQQKSLIKLRHSASIKEGLATVREVIDCAKRTFDLTSEAYSIMARRSLAGSELKDYVDSIFRTPDRPADKPVRELEKVEALFESGLGSDIPGVRGTAWGAYNAVSEYLSHHRGTSDAKRMDSLYFGEAGNLNTKAFDLALKI